MRPDSYDAGLCATSGNRTQGSPRDGRWNVVRGATLIALQAPLSMESEHMSAAKRFMRGVIDFHLGNHSLRSREILQFIA